METTARNSEIGSHHPVTTPSTPDLPSAEKGVRPLTIVIGCDTFAPDVNGAARFAERLAAGLAGRGHDVHVVAPAQKYRRFPPRTEIIEGVPLTVHRIPAVRWPPHDWLRFVWPWRSKHYARKVLDSVRPDVVHIQSHIVIGRGLARGP
ncbi:MAG: glucosyl transferase [Microbacterium sp.]|nr:glucosyl transferase [Microbacterium sp.]